MLYRRLYDNPVAWALGKADGICLPFTTWDVRSSLRVPHAIRGDATASL